MRLERQGIQLWWCRSGLLMVYLLSVLTPSTGLALEEIQTVDSASLDLLADIVLPLPVPGWPPATGWYVVALLLVVALLAGGLLSWRQRRRNLFRRQALAELERVESGLHGLLQVAEIIKRTVVATTDRRTVATLKRAQWVQWLNAHGRGAVFSDLSAHLLVDALYHSEPVSEAAFLELKKQTAQWIRKHRITRVAADSNPSFKKRSRRV